MTEGRSEELWKKAYRKAFETDPDADVRNNPTYVELWRRRWQAACENREPWAMDLADGDEAAA